MVTVDSANIDQLKGMPDVEFDFGVSAALKTAFRAEATTIEGQRGSRASWRTTGLTDFAGHFSQVFRQNGTTQLGDLDEVVTNLRLVATEVEKLEQAAREENQRRQTAREWAKRQADRNGFEKWWDDNVSGGEDPPAVTISDSGPSANVTAPPQRARQTPPPGGGSAGGRTSARPKNLRSFATSTTHGDGELTGSAPRLVGQCSSFDLSCRWATLDASGPIQGIRDWLRLNGEDAKWATTVADAFKRAGSEGEVSTLSNAAVSAALRSAGVAEARRDIEVDPPTAYGSPPTTGYSDDPVNTATGNFVENECDLDFTGPSASLQLVRSYSSLNPEPGAFGPGWSSWTDVLLSVDENAARLRLPDGRQLVFPRLGEGWDRAKGENLWLARRDTDARPGFTMTSAAGLRWEFRADGRLGATSSGPGTAVAFEHDAAGRLVRMTHERGRSVELTWDETTPTRVRAAGDDGGRRVDYVYDGAGRLVTAHAPGGDRHYRWTADAGAGLIEAVIDADGVVEAENAYDELGRVIAQRSPFGRTTRYVYLPGGITEVSDVDGERANTWICDGRGRLIGVVDADGRRQSTSYDRAGNPVVVTQRDGSAVLSFYDERGRRTRQVTPAGADLGWVYDDADRPVEATVTADDVTATTLLRYEGSSRNPAEIVDPEGGVTTMRWNDGLLLEVVDPTGVAVRFGYDERGDLVSSTDADGNVARLERDALGRVTAATTPMGHRTTYRYDGTGPLVSRQDANGGTWRYEHTPAGRLHATTDPTGARTEIEHGPHGRSVRTVDALGRAVETAYNDLGNRSRVELPDGSAWEFGYDASSRLVATTDPTGATWSLGHGPQGDLVETLDPTGVRRTVQRDVDGNPVRSADAESASTATYDALGRTTSETGPDGAAHRYRYDRCGRMVEHVQPGGGTTSIVRDAAGRPRHVTHPGGSTFHLEYDALGRRSAIVDTDGSRYGFGFDADGRLVEEVWPTGERAWSRYDALGQVVERHEPGRGTTRFGYDAAGRVVRTSDGWSGTRRFRYDAAGQLVEAVDALGGVTRFEHDAVGRCVAVVDPLGGRSERAFDAAGHLVATTDPLGRTTRFGFDAAGRQTRRVDPTGEVSSWTYDDAGRLTASYAGDVLLSSLSRDEATRTTRVLEADEVHELVFDAMGHLVRRSRGDAVTTWTYDADGRRTSVTAPDGARTRYTYDTAGRVATVETPGLGRAVLERDAVGRVVALSAPGLHATWTWEHGCVVRLTTHRNGIAQVTEIERDDAGRVVSQTVDGRRTAYAYDAAGQLTEVRDDGGAGSHYAYDLGGRLVRETQADDVRSYVYDVAGQLLAQRDRGGVREFAYDARGRRVRESGPDSERRYDWDLRGHLRSATTITRSGDDVSAQTHRTRVDALGELAELDGVPVRWDTAAGLPTLAQVGGVAITGFGPATGLVADQAPTGEWLSPGASARAVGADPWQVGSGRDRADVPGLPPGVRVPDHGSLLLGELEWLPARVYDTTSRGFLSTDPVEAVPGASSWGNPYAYAGNDPRNASDPWGLHPVTDAELQIYRESNNGTLANAASAATNWVKDNWEYIAAGALIVGGIAVMCTGVGGPIGAAMIGGALMSAGASAGMQKFQNGSVDWGQVAVDGAIGGVAGLAGGGAGVVVARQAARTGLNCMGRNVLTGAAAGMADGGTSGALSYVTSGQPLTVSGFAEATGRGMAIGGATGGAGGAVFTRVSGQACFVAGTPVLLGDQTTSKAIEDVEVGDEVWATDPETGRAGARRVVDTYVHHDVATFEVETSSGTVVSTAEHPFWVDGRGWTPVRDLAAGDKLVDADGVRVELMALRPTGETATVHNLHVEDLHTYHVAAGQDWVLVHNSCEYSPTYSELRSAGSSDAHHIIQDAAVRDLPGYSRSGAPAIQLDGPSTQVGSPHYNATQVQRTTTAGGTYGAERQVAESALRAAGKSDAEISDALTRSDSYFMDHLGVTHDTPTRIPGGRPQ